MFLFLCFLFQVICMRGRRDNVSNMMTMHTYSQYSLWIPADLFIKVVIKNTFKYSRSSRSCTITAHDLARANVNLKLDFYWSVNEFGFSERTRPRLLSFVSSFFVSRARNRVTFALSLLHPTIAFKFQRKHSPFVWYKKKQSSSQIQCCDPLIILRLSVTFIPYAERSCVRSVENRV